MVLSFPSPIKDMKLSVSIGTSPNVQTFEQTILPSQLSGTFNSIQINDSLVNAVISQPLGTPVSASIETTYEWFPSNSNTISTVIQAPPATNGGNGGNSGNGGNGDSGVGDDIGFLDAGDDASLIIEGVAAGLSMCSVM